MLFDFRKRTIRDISNELFGNKSISEICIWPPDAFALTSIILSESGAYRCVVSPPEDVTWPPVEGWQDIINEEAEKWRIRWGENSKGEASEKFQNIIDTLELFSLIDIVDLDHSILYELFYTIIELHAIADQACEGIGIPDGAEDGLLFYAVAHIKLQLTGTLSTIDTSKLRILPKLRTPQIGISLRSLSHHLAYDKSEVGVEWDSVLNKVLPSSLKTLNILILPWPLVVEASDFKESKSVLTNLDDNKFSFFEYVASETFDKKLVIKLIEQAQNKVGKIHGIILPENALTEAEVNVLESIVKGFGIGFFVTGVRGKKQNYADLGIFRAEKYSRNKQHKHHRWLLDGSQIKSYHLASSLHPDKKYWELIDIPKRTIQFTCINDWFSMCHLICEDLARHDPVAHLVRSVGPTLIVALLFDGPQLSQRWSGRYASVLADDPGSSVLTVTPLGMSKRCRPEGMKESRVIGLWKDSKNGPREIALEPGQLAAVITLSAQSENGWSADGRQDYDCTTTLVLSSIETF